MCAHQAETLNSQLSGITALHKASAQLHQKPPLPRVCRFQSYLAVVHTCQQLQPLTPFCTRLKPPWGTGTRFCRAAPVMAHRFGSMMLSVAPPTKHLTAEAAMAGREQQAGLRSLESSVAVWCMLAAALERPDTEWQQHHPLALNPQTPT